MTDFDHYSNNYQATLDCTLSLSGENSEYFSEYKAQWIKRFLGQSFNGQILDYGCGIGLLAKFLQSQWEKKQVKVTGFDPSSKSIAAARKRAPTIDFHVTPSSLRLNSMDVLVIANVLHHVKPDSRGLFFKEVLSFLKTGGQVIIFEHNPINPLTLFIVKTCAFDHDAHLLFPWTAQELVKANGIEKLKLDYIVFFPKPLHFFRSLEASLAPFPFGAQYVLTGCKK